MSRLKSISSELGLVFLVMAMLPILASYVVVNGLFGNAIDRERQQTLNLIADTTYSRIEAYVHQLLDDIETLARTPQLIERLRQPDTSPSREVLAFQQSYRAGKGYFDMLLVDRHGIIRQSLAQPEVTGLDIHGPELRDTELVRMIEAANTLLQTEVSNFAYFPPSDSHAAFLAAPMFDAGQLIGNVVLQIDNRRLEAIINRFEGLGDSGEILVGALENGQMIITMPPRHDPGLHSQPVSPSDFAPLRAALEGDQGSGLYIDRYGHQSLAVWRYLPALNWGMVVKVDTDELQQPIRRFEYLSLLLLLASIGLVLLGMLLCNRLVSRPIMRLAEAVRSFDDTETPEQIRIRARHEIRDLIRAFNALVSRVHSHQQQLRDRVRRRTEALSEANAKVQEYLDIIDSQVLISCINDQGRIAYVSSALRQRNGYQRQQLLGASCWHVLYPLTSCRQMGQILDQLHRGQVWEGELLHQQRTGEYYWTQETFTPDLGPDGRLQGFTCISQDISDRKAVEAISLTDPLTGLANRRSFEQQLKQEMAQARLHRRMLLFCLIDVDHFKDYNDHYGHPAGDRVLQRLGQLLMETFRRHNEYTFRIGGEEFALLLPIDSLDAAREIASRMVRQVEALDIVHNQGNAGMYLTISMGVRVLLPTGDPVDGEQLFQQADKLLYQAKHRGRNGFVLEAGPPEPPLSDRPECPAGPATAPPERSSTLRRRAACAPADPERPR